MGECIAKSPTENTFLWPVQKLAEDEDISNKGQTIHDGNASDDNGRKRASTGRKSQS
ncbi:hypothetical protein SAMD00023353_1202420 [Rosellinia necatrix]|uniref:Uncharacterized protein n=1 Tax=Rosellinia necatrix TaxID=77044 RepID=A0A1S8A7P9_ROSNE|nr:hypothetical protein SAMD00023353_1202420 [Rosellinia necatrix]